VSSRPTSLTRNKAKLESAVAFVQAIQAEVEALWILVNLQIAPEIRKIDVQEPIAARFVISDVGYFTVHEANASLLGLFDNKTTLINIVTGTFLRARSSTRSSSATSSLKHQRSPLSTQTPPGRAGTSTSGASRRCGDIDILDRRGLSVARTRIWGPDVFRFDQRLAEVERSRTESNANNHRAAKHRAEGNLARLDNVVADRPG
jgi:hypothetical protein